MRARKVLLYFAWSRPGEAGASLGVIDDRFPGIFELRRLFYPKFESLADGARIDQGIAGFLDHIQKPNFQEFAQQAEALTGDRVTQIERIDDTGILSPLDAVADGVDTIVVISFDSFRTHQAATAGEIGAMQRFLDNPDHLLFVCPHHEIGEAAGLDGESQNQRQLMEHLHHGDPAIPPRQGFGGLARTLLSGLGVPIDNRFGLRPAAAADGSPAPVEIERGLDELGLLRDVSVFNLHPHLPQLERIGPSMQRMDVLARQRIDLTAPPHPFVEAGRSTFDALLQSRLDTFAGKLLVCDATMFSSTAGGIEDLRRFWTNIVRRPSRR